VEGDDNEDCCEEAHIFDSENMRVVKEFNSVGDLILVAHKLTLACKDRL